MQSVLEYIPKAVWRMHQDYAASVASYTCIGERHEMGLVCEDAMAELMRGDSVVCVTRVAVCTMMFSACVRVLFHSLVSALNVVLLSSSRRSCIKSKTTQRASLSVGLRNAHHSSSAEQEGYE